MSFCRVTVLAVVLCCLHLENVGNDAVNRDITYQASEEKLLSDAGVHEAQGWETSQDTGQPGKTKCSHQLPNSLSAIFGKGNFISISQTETIPAFIVRCSPASLSTELNIQFKGFDFILLIIKKKSLKPS